MLTPLWSVSGRMKTRCRPDMISSMESLKIILLCIVAAIVYGILHDQVTARVCVEYFTIGHPPVFHTESPTLLAFGWGVIATWWMGLILSVPAVLASRVGTRPKFNAADLIRPIACLLVVMAVSSLLAGIAGYFIAKGGSVRLLGTLASRVPVEKHVAFLADLWAHSAAYGVGFFGGLVLCGWVVFRRRRLGGEQGFKVGAVVVARWTARILGTLILLLLATLAIGEGIHPSRMFESFGVALLTVAMLTMLLGQIVAWRWEGIGAGLILGSFALFSIVNHGVSLNIVFGPWLLTGILYLACCWMKGKTAGGVGRDSSG